MAGRSSTNPDRPTVYVVNNRLDELADLRALFARLNCTVMDFVSVEAFFAAYRTGGTGCLVVELQVSNSNGFGFLERLRETDAALPVIVVGQAGDVPIAVRAMRAGAALFVEKPYVRSALLSRVRRFLE